LNEEELRQRLFEEIVLFLNRYPFCRCLRFVGLRGGDKVLIDFEIKRAKLGKKRMAKGYDVVLGKRLGTSAAAIKKHYVLHGKKQFGAVNDFLDALVEVFREWKNS
jgi:hypothetical protein